MQDWVQATREEKDAYLAHRFGGSGADSVLVKPPRWTVDGEWQWLQRMSEKVSNYVSNQEQRGLEGPDVVLL